MTTFIEAHNSFRYQLECIINRHSKENGSNTPDFILAEYLNDCLIAFDKATTRRTKWYQPQTETGRSGNAPNPESPKEA